MRGRLNSALVPVPDSDRSFDRCYPRISYFPLLKGEIRDKGERFASSESIPSPSLRMRVIHTLVPSKEIVAS